MDPDEWLAHHRVMHEHQLARLLLLRMCIGLLFFIVAVMVFFAFRPV